MIRFVFLVWFSAISLANAVMPLEEQRIAYVKLSGDLASRIANDWPAEADGLINYPLYPALRYQWLKQNLSREQDIQRFLTEYSDTLYGVLLSKDYLMHLAGQARWSEFISRYQPSSSRALLCHYQWARFNTGLRELALQAAKKLWLTADVTPIECEGLFNAFIQSPYFSGDILWDRFELAVKKGRADLANQLMILMTEPERTVASLWLEVHNDPQSVLAAKEWDTEMPGIAKVFAYGVANLAHADVVKAMAVWDSTKSKFTLTSDLNDTVEGQLGLALAFRKNPAAYFRLGKVVKPDSSIREWKVRAALIERDWQHVLDALDMLGVRQSQQPRWQYWRARAMEALGRIDISRAIYHRLAEDRSLFGFLAAEKMEIKPDLKDRPLQINLTELFSFQRMPDVMIVNELRLLNRTVEARRYWQYLLSKLNKQQIMLAAKTAQQWGWRHDAVTALARVEYWDDMALRFPLAYLSEVNQAVTSTHLEPSIILGLIRRESIFDPEAISPAGARGLMQIMPGTGKQVAMTLKIPWESPEMLLKPDINIRFGANYFKQLLDRFNGHFMLAVAAYNAGPNKVKAWLSDIGSLPADIWMETLSYKETREYVAAVLGYAIIYQLRLNREELKADHFMRDVFSE